jgi:hypothetical protein
MTDYRTILELDLEQVARPASFTLYDVTRRRDRKRRNKRIAAGMVGIAVFVGAVWIVRDVASLDRSDTSVVPAGSGTTGPAETGRAETKSIFDPSADYVGLPPAGAEPSGPQDGTLIAWVHEIHVGWVYVYGDGRVISWSEGCCQPPAPSGYREQRLTSQGAELLRSELLSTGLFDRERHLRVEGKLYENRFRWGSAAVRDGNRFVQVTWGEALPGANAIKTSPTPEQAITLAGLIRLADPGSSLPASAWKDREFRPYVPYRYAICGDLNGLPGAAQELLRGKERTFDVSGPDQGRVRCFDVSTEEARAVDRILADAGFFVGSPGYAQYQRERWLGTDSVVFMPILPHGTFAAQPG